MKRLRLVVKDGREILCPRGYVLLISNPVGTVGFSSPMETVATSELVEASVLDDEETE